MTAELTWPAEGDGTLQILNDDDDPVAVRALCFRGGHGVDFTGAPGQVDVVSRLPGENQVAQAVGRPKPIADLALASGFAPVVGEALPGIGMDMGGIVMLRGRVAPASTVSAGTLASLTDQVLRPAKRVRLPVAKVNGTIKVLTVEADGTMKLDAVAGEDFTLDGVTWPSGVAFPDARSTPIEFLAASDDPDDPLQSVGDLIVGSMSVDNPPGILFRFADDALIEAGKHWHFAGSGTYRKEPAVQTGTFSVNSDDYAIVQSFVPPVTGAGPLRLTFAASSPLAVTRI